VAISIIKGFDPFRRRFLYLLDHLSLRNGSWQRCDNVDVITNTADVHEIGAEVAADCGQISMHTRSHVQIEPRLAILRAKDDMKDDSA